MGWAGFWLHALAQMNSFLFDSFSEMIEELPVKAVLLAADAQRRMLEDDIANKRLQPGGDVHSILTFCDFLAVTSCGEEVSCPPLPVEHCAFYRKIIQKLVEAGELPYDAQEQFDLCFSEALFRALTSPAYLEAHAKTARFQEQTLFYY